MTGGRVTVDVSAKMLTLLLPCALDLARPITAILTDVKYSD